MCGVLAYEKVDDYGNTQSYVIKQCVQEYMCGKTINHIWEDGKEYEFFVTCISRWWE